VFVPRTGPRYTEEEARTAIAESMSWAEALRNLGMCHGGGSAAVLKKYARIWHIPTDHFDPYAAARGPRASARALADVLVENSNYSRRSLKQRLFREGYKPRYCELCAQGEEWHGRPMGLILDHICSPACGHHAPGPAGPKPGIRKVDRPPCARLKREVAAMGWSAVGRRYGVSDNAVRKWIRWYEAEIERAGKAQRMKRFSCGQVVPGCGATFEAPDEEGILRQVVVHAREAHGMDEVPPDVADKVVAGIEDTGGDDVSAGVPPAPSG
jgi:predicted small metal-binding protein